MLKLHIKPIKHIFYNTDSNFGVFACEIAKENDDSKKIIYNIYGNITIKGTMPRLESHKIYIANVNEVKDPKYGYGYEIVTIYEEIGTSNEEQRKFLQALLTERQVKSIFEFYPNENIIELIEKDQFDYGNIKGIGEATYKKIKEKIIENKHLQNVYSTLCEYGISNKLIKKLSSHYPSPQILLEKVKENPYVLADEVNGIGYKKADIIALSKGVEPESFYRIYACLKYVLSENANNGHVFMKEKRLTKEMFELLNISISCIKDTLKDLRKDTPNEIVIIEDKFSLFFHYNNEQNIAYDISRLIKSSYSIEVDKLKEKIAEIEIDQGFDFTIEQKLAIQSALTKNVVLINGKAGTGKTSVIKGIVNIIRNANENFSYNTVALSGKASQRIVESTGLESSTIHRFLAASPKNLNSFTFHRNNPVDLDLLIIDEASMINAYLFSRILEALPNKTKLIITGDYSQLEPIGAGNVFYDLCNSEKVTRIELTQVHRQAQKSGILNIANEIREGISSFGKNDFTQRDIGELKDLHFFPFYKSENVYNAVINIAKAYKKREKDILKFQIITPMKKRGKLCTHELNIALQNIFNPRTGNSKSVRRGKIEFREKDKIIHNGNNYNIGVLNGTIGIIESINPSNENILINFETVGKVELSFSQLKDIDLSYALTIHRTQGSQFENCVVAFDYSSYIMLSRQLIYTALTRSIKHCYLICALEALQQAIKTDKGSLRNTFLSSFLKVLH